VSVVKINAITVEPERVDELIARFAARAGQVGGMEGFEAFELLKPVDDRNTFLVYTRWRSEEDFQAWVQSPAFAHGHKAHHEDGPVSTHSELWSFEVAQHERAASDS
jgi:heme-degrading monooxygenase HmoA